MKRFIIFIIFFCIVLFGLIFVSFKTEDRSIQMASSLLKENKLTTAVQFESAYKTFSDNALTLKDVTFANSPLPLTAKRVKILKSTSQDLNVQMKNVEWDSSLLLKRSKKREAIIALFRNYEPFLDIIREPIATLMLLNEEKINADIDLKMEINPITKTGVLSIFFFEKNLMKLHLEFSLQHLPADFMQTFLNFILKDRENPFSQENVKNIRFSFENKGFVEKYKAYLKMLPPEKVKIAEERNEAIKNFLYMPQAEVIIDYPTIEWIIKSSFYNNEKSNK